MAESKQHWLDRNRPPRVQITYDVETGGAIQKKELPFVVGIMADLSGNEGANSRPAYRTRKFVEIDRDNFNEVLAKVKPTVKVTVPNHLGGDSETIAAEFSISKLDDLDPGSLVMSEQIQPLRDQMDERQRLTELLTKLDGNDVLAAFLLAVASEKPQLEAAVTAGEAARVRLAPAPTE